MADKIIKPAYRLTQAQIDYIESMENAPNFRLDRAEEAELNRFWFAIFGSSSVPFTIVAALSEYRWSGRKQYTLLQGKLLMLKWLVKVQRPNHTYTADELVVLLWAALNEPIAYRLFISELFIP